MARMHGQMNLLKIFILLVASFSLVNVYAQDEDKSEKIAHFIQSKVDYTTCRSLGEALVRCDIRLPIGTSMPTGISSIENVANTFAQVGRMASTVYYTGYIGSQKICEYKYDMWSGTVSKEF